MGRQQRGSTVGRTGELEHGGDDLADLVFGLAGPYEPADDLDARALGEDPAAPATAVIDTSTLEAEGVVVPGPAEDSDDSDGDDSGDSGDGDQDLPAAEADGGPGDDAQVPDGAAVLAEPDVPTPPRGTPAARTRFVGPSLEEVVEPRLGETVILSAIPVVDEPEPVLIRSEPVVVPGSSPEPEPEIVVEQARVVRPSADLVVVAEPSQRRPAATGWRGFLRRATRGVIDLEPGPRERAVIEAATEVRTRWQGPRTVVVANPKGGSGKTPTAIGLAATFGHVRGGGVLAWDANETLGTLGMRTPGDASPSTVVDLLENLDEFERRGARRGDLGAVVRAQESGNFHVLASDEDPRRMSQIDAEGFARLHDVLQRYYDVLVVDTGNNPRAEGFVAALAVADALVIPVSWAEDKVVTAGRLVDQLREMGRDDLVERAVTVVTGPWGSGTTPAQARSWRAWFAEQTAAVVQVPTDARIGGGGPIVYDELGAATRRAYLFGAQHVSDVFSSLGPTSDLLSPER